MIRQYWMPELATLRESSKEHRVQAACWKKWGNTGSRPAPTVRKGSLVQLFSVCLHNATWLTGLRENFCFVVSLSAKAYRRNLPLLHPARKSYQAEFCCSMSLATVAGLKHGWRRDTYCGASSVAFSWLRKVSVPSLIKFS